MFNMVIVTIGLFEFLLGCVIAIFYKNRWADKYVKYLYDIDKSDKSSLPKLNKWIGENCALVGSIYVFAGSLTRMLGLNWFYLAIIIGIAEWYSYNRIEKGIIKILKDSQ